MRTVGLTFEPAPKKEPEEFICWHCGKEFKTAAALKAHCKKEHPEQFDDTND